MTGKAVDCVAQLSSGTVGSHRAAAAYWRAARCWRWWNEPSEQETALHAIGLVFENRKGTCSLLMGLFLWHDRRQALCVTVTGKKVLVVEWQWPFKGTNILGQLSTCWICFSRRMKTLDFPLFYVALFSHVILTSEFNTLLSTVIKNTQTLMELECVNPCLVTPHKYPFF